MECLVCKGGHLTALHKVTGPTTTAIFNIRPSKFVPTSGFSRQVVKRNLINRIIDRARRKERKCDFIDLNYGAIHHHRNSILPSHQWKLVKVGPIR
jgi:hypothetical protein